MSRRLPEEEMKCLAMWGRFKAGGRPLDAERVRSMAGAAAIDVVDLALGSIGRFRPMEAWLVRTGEGVLALPLRTPQELLHDFGLEQVSGPESFWTSVGWLHPAFFLNHEVAELRRAVELASALDRERVLASELEKLYQPEHIASLLLNRYSQLDEFLPFIALIREAAEVFFHGYRRAGVAALVPVVEGVLSRFLGRLRGQQHLDVTGVELLRQAVNAECERAATQLVYHGRWVPREYRERAFLEKFDDYIHLLSLLEWFGSAHFFAKTSAFEAGHNLNRHGILHGVFHDFGRSENFYRLWSILDLVAFAVSMGASGVSSLAPALTPEARQLALQFRVLGRVRRISEQAALLLLGDDAQLNGGADS